MILRLCLVAAASASCVQPVYDDRLGVSGVRTEEGALAGRFGLVVACADLANVPLLGEQLGGGMTFLLVDRAYDGEQYQQKNEICRVINYETAGLASTIADETARAIPDVDVSIHIDHRSGAMSTDQYHELWAVTDLAPDEPMPTSATDARFYDMEGDGNPGATVTTSGLVAGELYFAQRKWVTLSTSIPKTRLRAAAQSSR